MIIKASTIDYDIGKPQYGYTTRITMDKQIQELSSTGYGIWDNGSSYDVRIFKAVFRLNATLTNTLLDIFNDVDKGRGISVSLVMGTNSGIYPFGPDHGDSGTFGVRLTEIVANGVTEEPWLYFDTELTFVEESNPAYSLPSEVSDGALRIGTITNLRYPERYPESSTDYGFATNTTRDGTNYTVDKTIGMDNHLTTLNMSCNQSKAAALIDHMTGTVRDNNLTIIEQANNYLFGREVGEGNTYTCQWLDTSIVINNPRFDYFTFPLTFYHVSTA